MANTDSPAIYQLKITLDESKPPIWRRVLLKGSSTLYHLHRIIQVCMGWEDAHLHQFKIGNKYYGSKNTDIGRSKLSEERATLHNVAREGYKFWYEYDFGDSWLHQIKVEKVREADPKRNYPYCVTGKRRGPLEDTGGIWGYEDFLEALANPKHPGHKEMKAWIQESYGLEKYDPDQFDLGIINQELQELDY